MRKTFIITIALSLTFFTGCFGGGEETEDSDIQNFTTYNAPAFSISIPNGWEIIEPKDFSNEIPTETQVIFRNNVKSDIFTPNANITKELLTSPQTAYEYAKSSISENKGTLQNYKEITRDEEFNIVVGGKMQKSILIMFEGKQTESEPTIRIIQTYAVNATDAYTVTAAYLQSSDELTVDIAKNIVKSFKIK